MGRNVSVTSSTFSKLMEKALTEGRQRVDSAQGTVFLISEEELQKIEGTKPSFKEFLFSIPNTEGIDLTRDKRPLRDIEW